MLITPSTYYHHCILRCIRTRVDEKVGEGQIPHTSKFDYSFDEGFDIGRDSGSPVSEEYKAGTQFTGGNIERVVIDLVGERHIDAEAEARIQMNRQ